MKKFSYRKLALYIGIILLLLPLAGLVTATPAPQGGRSGAPTVMSYQGQVMVGGSPYSGTGYFKFAVVDSTGTSSYWSNDSSSSAGSEPTAGVALSVDTGLFNVLLGDTTLTGMNQTLSADVFSGTDRWLRVWFSSDNSSYQLLTPDQRIAAVPYALQAENAADADTLDGLDGSAYQRQISGGCSVGSTIRTINADGTVECQIDAPLRRSAIPEPNLLTTVDSGGDVGRFTSITIGADGLPVISYYDYTNGDLKVAHCRDAACSTSSLTTVDSVGDVGINTSITIGADGLPVISYYDYTNSDLKVAHCGDAACSTSSLTTVDSVGDVGGESSITIGADGLPVISYYDYTYLDLKVVHCGDLACSMGNSLITLDMWGNVGINTSITIGADGLPVISYCDWDNGNLKVAHCGDTACSMDNTLTTLDPGGVVGRYPSITIGADGLPVISYQDSTNYDLKVAHCGDAACSTSSLTTVDSGGYVGLDTSITIGADGLPVIIYYDFTNRDLKVAHCGDAACSTSSLTTVDSVGDVGRESSITIGTDGLPVISYFDATNQDLKVAHCENVFCIPYWRRR